ncbi:MAG TPA: glycosyltransferase family 4 protein, partial [Microlunatus sp.]|nr:glycosyltransferase family 4 protein [Microlunatus sp.]
SPTGGNVYHERLVVALSELGIGGRIVRVGAGWPDGTAADRGRLVAALRDHPVTLVDGIVAGNAPLELAAAPGRIGVLVHLPLADEQGLSPDRARSYRASERAALAVADVVLCPSRRVALELAKSYDRANAIVAEPGVDLAPVAAGSTPPHLLWLGAVTATKNPLRFVEALSELTDLDWTAALVGAERDPAVGAQVRRAMTALEGRVMVTGALVAAELEREWVRTDLLVSTSVVETYGLVVAEALAHGIPAVVPAGTGAVEALGEVDGLPPGRAADPAELVPELRRWLSDPGRRRRWRERALRRRSTLPSWAATARVVRDALLIRDDPPGG